MNAIPIDVQEVRRGLSAAAVDVAGLIRSLPDLGAATTGLEWTIGQTAAHLVAMTHEYTGYATGALPA